MIPKILIPYDPREAITLKQAAARAGRSDRTLAAWCEGYGLGRKIGGRYIVSRVALEMHLDGNTRALERYHDGEREHPTVAEYRARLGL
jgi:hypothetical protein